MLCTYTVVSRRINWRFGDCIPCRMSREMKKPYSSRPYLCFLAEHMNVPPTDDAVYYLQE